MKSDHSKGKFSIQNIHFTSTVSMSLVLFLIGLVTLILFAARDTATQIKENINLSVILDDNISDSKVKRIQQFLETTGYIKSQNFISKEDALKEHVEAMGENPEKFLGFNPLMASIEVKLNAAYANMDSVNMIEQRLKVFPDITRVAYQKDMVSLVNDNVKKISIILLSIAAVLLLISFALINNTIKVSVYSNRFLINTMKLVGATPWFIRWPYIRRGMINGALASVISLIMLTGMTLYIQNEFSLNFLMLQFSTLINLVLIVMILGVTLTALSSYLAVGRFLKMKTNDMYFV